MTTNTYIYSLSEPNTDIVRYIGKSDNPNRRLSEHYSRITDKYKSHKINWIKSLILNKLYPKLDIIDEIPKDEWKFWEQYYISLYRSWGFNLVNTTIGGEGFNGNHSEKTKLLFRERMKNLKGKKYEEIYGEAKAIMIKKRLSHKKKGIKRKPLSKENKIRLSKIAFQKGHIPWNKGIKNCFSRETLIKMGNSRKGKKWTEEQRSKIMPILLKNNSSDEKRHKMKNLFSSIKRTENWCNNISKALKGKKLSRERKIKMKKVWESNKKKILQYDINGNFIKKWDSMTNAALSIGIKDKSNIGRACNNQKNTAGGYIWKYSI